MSLSVILARIRPNIYINSFTFYDIGAGSDSNLTEFCYRMLPCRCLCWAKSGSTVGGNFHFVKDRKSVILEVWAAPGAPEALPKAGGLAPNEVERRDAARLTRLILGRWFSIEN